MKYNPDTPSPPGDTIRDWMAENGVDMPTMAERLGVCEITMTQLCDGQIYIDQWVARALAQETKVPAEFWLNRERMYRQKIKALTTTSA